MAAPVSAEELWAAWERVAENEGCAGADAVTVHLFGQRVHRELERLGELVATAAYRALPLLKIVVEKRPGSAKTRTLLVPTVRDRVIQTAVARALSRSFEEEFLECSYGYRPGRSVDRAIARIRKCRELGYRCVVDADVQTFFDEVDHDLLLARLGERRPGEHVMELLRQWVRADVWDGQHVRKLKRGVPQGSPISPLLANFFLEDFDRELEKSGRKLVRYADDFLVLAKTPEEAQQALVQTEELLAAAHLSLNQEKTRIVDFEHGFQFLGALFEGEGIWVPWKHQRAKGRILFMARPMPLALRTEYETLPRARGTMDEAFHKLGRTTAGPREAPEAKRSDAVAYLYITEQGAVLRKAGDRFLVDKDDEVMLDLPYHKLETVLLFGNIQVTTQAMAELLEKGVNLSLFSRQGQYRGSLAPPRGRNIDLRVKQYEAYRDSGRALVLARGIVEAKVANGLAVLEYYRKFNDASEAFQRQRQTIEAALSVAGTAADVSSLLGIEGTAAREYFACVMEFNKSEMKWEGRRKHPSTDPLNALLSLTYSLLLHELAGLLEGAGLEPYLGYLHQVDYGRPSLALDLLEPLRHPVADRLTLTLVNRRTLEEDDFLSQGEGRGVFLKPKAMKRYLDAYEKWMTRRGAPEGEKEDASGQNFRDALRAQVERFASALRDDKPFEPFRWGASGGAGCNTSSVTI